MKHLALLAALLAVQACSSDGKSGDDAGTDADTDTDVDTDTDTVPDCGIHDIVHITGTGADEVFVFSWQGAVMHIDGDTWSYEQIPEANIEAAWAAQTGEVFAVGRGEGGGEETPVPVVWMRDGSGWSDAFSHDDLVLTDVWGMSASQVFATGTALSTDQGEIVRFDGSEWLELGCEGLDELFGIWGSSATDVWAVGPTDIARFDGETCAKVDVTGDPEVLPGLADIWGSLADDVFAVGPAQVDVWHYDGSEWTGVVSESGVGRTAIWGAAYDDYFVVGHSFGVVEPEQPVFVWHYDGVEWDQTQLTLGVAVLSTVWGSAGDDVYTAGECVIAHYDGTDWSMLCNCPY